MIDTGVEPKTARPKHDDSKHSWGYGSDGAELFFYGFFSRSTPTALAEDGASIWKVPKGASR